MKGSVHQINICGYQFFTPSQEQNHTPAAFASDFATQERRQSVFLLLMEAEFVYMTCFGPWNILEDMMQAGSLHILVDLAWPLVILQSAMTGA